MSRLPVIEIDSSESEHAPKRAVRVRAPRRARTRQRSIPVNDVIELTDSDDEPAQSKPSKEAAPRPQIPEAGPSHASHIPQVTPVAGQAAPAALIPLFYPESDDEPIPGPSMPMINQAPPRILDPSQPLSSIPALEPDSRLSDASAPAEDPYDAYVAQVVEIVPDVLPEHARALVEQHFPSQREHVLEAVLHVLFENPAYPKADPRRKLKRKWDDVREDVTKNARPKVDFLSQGRVPAGGANYKFEALVTLYSEFPTTPVPYIRARFTNCGSLYAPTYLCLSKEAKQQLLPCKMRSNRTFGKGKAIVLLDVELQEEIEWVKHHLEEDTGGAQVPSVQDKPEDQEQTEDGIECGCCFSTHSFDKMIQCPDAHLFCTECMTSYASTLLGSHNADLVCMDQSGCTLAFPESELRRFLTPKLLGLYERVKQQKEIEAAGLDNLEECPFCEYKCVIENEQEKLFRCENQDCLAISCRACKKPDHLPKSCKEVEDDKKLDARHVIEEAMTRALMRNCPKCQKAFVKEMGCNKMLCPNCATLSCYVCRKIITGYEHFSRPPPYTGPADPNKCQLWDSVEQRHSDEVTAAAQKALEEYKRAHPEVAEEDIKVDLPPPPPPAGPSNAPIIPALGRVRPNPAYIQERLAFARQVAWNNLPVPVAPQAHLLRHPVVPALPGFPPALRRRIERGIPQRLAAPRFALPPDLPADVANAALRARLPRAAKVRNR